MTDLDALIAAVLRGTPCIVPSLKAPGQTMRIMCYCEGYAMARHKGAGPFVVSTKAILDDLRAFKAASPTP